MLKAIISGCKASSNLSLPAQQQAFQLSKRAADVFNKMVFHATAFQGSGGNPFGLDPVIPAEFNEQDVDHITSQLLSGFQVLSLLTLVKGDR